MTEVHLIIDGERVAVPLGTTIFDAARMHGIPIPTLCHQQNLEPIGVCRMCAVDIGENVLAAACVRLVEEKMIVNTNSEKLPYRRTLIELLMSDHASPCARQRSSHDCELETLARRGGIDELRFARRTSPKGQDNSSPLLAVDYAACILCDRCIRGCNDFRHYNVLGRKGKGFSSGIAFDNDVPVV